MLDKYVVPNYIVHHNGQPDIVGSAAWKAWASRPGQNVKLRDAPASPPLSRMGTMWFLFAYGDGCRS